MRMNCRQAGDLALRAFSGVVFSRTSASTLPFAAATPSVRFEDSTGRIIATWQRFSTFSGALLTIELLIALVPAGLMDVSVATEYEG